MHMDLRYITLITKNRGNWILLLSMRGRHCQLEVKSGKDYTKHRALTHVLESPNYHIQNAIVFCNENIEVKESDFLLSDLYGRIFGKENGSGGLYLHT